MSDSSAEARAAKNRARMAAIQAEKTRPTRCIVATRTRIAEKPKGEEVFLPADQAQRLVARGYVQIVPDDPAPAPAVEENPKPVAEAEEVPAEKPANRGPSAYRARKK